VVGRLARAVGLRTDATPVKAEELVEGFLLDRIPPPAGGIVVDPSDW
jgi:hypothetical protein